MGVDWVRFQLKPEADRAELEALIERQAIAYQSISSWYELKEITLLYDLMKEVHEETYLNTSKKIKELAILPEWDRERKCAVDIPNLRISLPIVVITSRPIFPPLWRLQACRTFLPDRLAPQLARWKQWVDGVLRGTHDKYLHELHLYETCKRMRYHWSVLSGYAKLSLEKTTNWATKPEFVEVRKEIINLPEPLSYEIPIDPTRTTLLPGDRFKERYAQTFYDLPIYSFRRTPPDSPFEERYAKTLEEARNLARLTRQWDSKVRGKWKVQYYENCYLFTFDEFRNLAADYWLREFFAWADRCVELGFGLYLDC